MATVRMPSSWAERKTRMAISLRLATSSFLNGRTGTAAGIGISREVAVMIGGEKKRAGPAGRPVRRIIRRGLVLVAGLAANRDCDLALRPVVGHHGDRL